MADSRYASDVGRRKKIPEKDQGKKLAESASKIESPASPELTMLPMEIPRNIHALEDATSDAFAFAEADLGLWMRVSGRQNTSDELTFITTSFESWVQVTALLEDAFFKRADGALAKQLLELVKMDASELRESVNLQAALALLRETSKAADTIYPLLGQLVRLNPGMSREDMARMIFTDNPEVAISEEAAGKQARYSLPGLLHKLGERVKTIYEDSAKEVPVEADAWNIEREVKLKPEIRIADPFSESPESKAYYADRMELMKRGGEEEPSILKVARQRTERLIAELENLREQVSEKENPMLADAYSHLEEWLEAKMVYYSAERLEDVKLYHIGLENPAEQMALIAVLDEIKQANPELFLELTGTNPKDNGRSSYFGSFLHSALYHTQKAVELADAKAGRDLRLGIMFRQLLRLDERVDMYYGTLTKDNYQMLVEDAMKRIEGEKTAEGKGALAQILGAVLVRPAIEAQVNSELEAMREVNVEKFKSELKERLADVAHPALTLEFLGKAPITALRDPDVGQELRVIFGKELKNEQEVVDFREACAERDISLEKALFDRIPIFDYEKGEWGPFYKALAESTMPPLRNLLANQLTSSEDYADTGKMDVLARGRARLTYEAVQGVPGLSLLERAWLNATTVPFRRTDERGYRFDESRLAGLPFNDQPIDFVDFFITHPRSKIIQHYHDRIKGIGADNVMMAFLNHPKGVKELQEHFDELIELVPEDKRENLIVRLFNWDQYKKYPELLPLAIKHPELLARATNGVDPQNGRPYSMLDSAFSATFPLRLVFSPLTGLRNVTEDAERKALGIFFQNIERTLNAAKLAKWDGLQESMLDELKTSFRYNMDNFLQSLEGSNAENLVSYGKYEELKEYFARILEIAFEDEQKKAFKDALLQELEHLAPSALEATATYFLKPENFTADVALAMAQKAKTIENIDIVKFGEFCTMLKQFPEAATEFAKHISEFSNEYNRWNLSWHFSERPEAAKYVIDKANRNGWPPADTARIPLNPKIIPYMKEHWEEIKAAVGPVTLERIKEDIEKTNE